MINGIIFDLDGTLITSEDVIEDALRKVVLKLTGAEVNMTLFQDVRREMMSTPETESMSLFCHRMGLTEPVDSVSKMYFEFQKKGFPGIVLTPGAERLVRHLYAHRIPMSIATNTVREKVLLKTAHLRDTMDLIPHVVAIDDVLFGKPSPDSMRKAAGLMGLEPSSCLVFDDSPKGIVAAQRAGMPSIGLTFRITPKEMPGADDYLPDLSHFDPTKWGLPPFGDE